MNAEDKLNKIHMSHDLRYMMLNLDKGSSHWTKTELFNAILKLRQVLYETQKRIEKK